MSPCSYCREYYCDKECIWSEDCQECGGNFIKETENDIVLKSSDGNLAQIDEYLNFITSKNHHITCNVMSCCGTYDVHREWCRGPHRHIFSDDDKNKKFGELDKYVKGLSERNDKVLYKKCKCMTCSEEINVYRVVKKGILYQYKDGQDLLREEIEELTEKLNYYNLKIEAISKLVEEKTNMLLE